MLTQYALVVTRKTKRSRPNTSCVAVRGDGSVRVARSAVCRGAFDPERITLDCHRVLRPRPRPESEAVKVGRTETTAYAICKAIRYGTKKRVAVDPQYDPSMIPEARVPRRILEEAEFYTDSYPEHDK